MASMMRPTVLRQSLFATTRKAFSTKPSISHAFRPAAIRPATSILSERSLPAAFHTSSRRAILPAGPQVIEGGVNDPAPVPKPSPTHGSYHWTFERALSLGLVPLTIAPFAYGSLNPVMDSIFVAAILLHSHVGFTSIIIDYIPYKRHPGARRLFEWLLRIATLTVGIGFYEFETNDVGLTEGVKRIWKAGSTDKAVGPA